LNVNPSKRLSCDSLLKHDLITKRSSMDNMISCQGNLLNTIKVPVLDAKINDILPKFKRYNTTTISEIEKDFFLELISNKNNIKSTKNKVTDDTSKDINKNKSVPPKLIRSELKKNTLIPTKKSPVGSELKRLNIGEKPVMVKKKDDIMSTMEKKCSLGLTEAKSNKIYVYPTPTIDLCKRNIGISKSSVKTKALSTKNVKK
jgi:hypothetical protein